MILTKVTTPSLNKDSENIKYTKLIFNKTKGESYTARLQIPTAFLKKLKFKLEKGLDSKHRTISIVLTSNLSVILRKVNTKVKIQNKVIANKFNKEIANINVLDNEITISYFNDYKFKKVIEGYLYKWNGVAWEKKLGVFTECSEDAAAEIADKLIENHINIILDNDNAYKLLMDKSYKRERFRWVVTKKNSDKLFFVLRKRETSNFIKTFKSFDGIHYKKGEYSMDASLWHNISDFIKKNNFRLSEESINKILFY